MSSLRGSLATARRLQNWWEVDFVGRIAARFVRLPLPSAHPVALAVANSIARALSTQTHPGGPAFCLPSQRTWVARLDQPDASYVVIPLCFGNSPTAAETTARQPFSVRLWSSEPLRVGRTSAYPPSEAATVRQIDWCSELALQAVHLAMLSELAPPMPAPRGFGRAAELERLLCLPQHAAMLMDLGGAGARVSRRLVQLSPTAAALVAKGAELTLVAGYHWGRPDEAPLTLRVTAYVKSCAARAAEGQLVNLKDAADAYYQRLRQEQERALAERAARGIPPREERERGPRWPAKWAAYRTVARVAPQSRRLLMVVAASGVQAEIGEIEVEAVSGAEAAGAPAHLSAASSSTAARREAEASAASAMARWLGRGAAAGSVGGSGSGAGAAAGSQSNGGGLGIGSSGAGGSGSDAGGPTPAAPSAWLRGSSAEGVFAAAPFSQDEWVAASVFLRRKGQRSPTDGGGSNGGEGEGGLAAEDAALKAALEASSREHHEQSSARSQSMVLDGDDPELSAAIAASLADCVPPASGTLIAPTCERSVQAGVLAVASEEQQLALALEASRREAADRSAGIGDAQDAELRRAIDLSRQLAEGRHHEEVGGSGSGYGGSAQAPIELLDDDGTDEDDVVKVQAQVQEASAPRSWHPSGDDKPAISAEEVRAARLRRFAGEPGM